MDIVGIVNVQVERLPSTALFVGEPAIGAPGGHGCVPSERRGNRPAKQAALDELTGHDVLGPEPDAVADLEHPSGAAGCRGHAITVRHVERHRFLAEHVHAGLERLDRGVRVQERRQGDGECIDRSGRKQLAQVGMDADILQVDVIGRAFHVSLGGFTRGGQHLGVGLADRCDRGVGDRFPAAIVHTSHETQPDNPHANHGEPLSWRHDPECPGHGALAVFSSGSRYDTAPGKRWSNIPLHDSPTTKPAKNLRPSIPAVADHLLNDTCRIYPDLAAVVNAWPQPSGAIKAGILAMVPSVIGLE